MSGLGQGALKGEDDPLRTLGTHAGGGTIQNGNPLWRAMIFYIVPGLFVIGVIGSLVTFPWKRRDALRKLPLLMALILPPIASFAWGRVFSVVPGSYNPHLQFWVGGFLWVAVLLSALMPIVLLPRMAGARWFTALTGLTMATITVAVSFIAAMQVSGAWI